MQRRAPLKSAQDLEQQSPSRAQLSPALRQTGSEVLAWQVVPLQLLLQHAVSVVQASPMEAQTLARVQAPAAQLSEQQSAALVQAAPSISQEEPPARQTPTPLLSAQRPEQQSAPSVQAPPEGAQAMVVMEQMPFWLHMPEQQSVLVVHELLSDRQLAHWLLSASHVFEQHSVSWVQWFVSSRQVAH